MSRKIVRAKKFPLCFKKIERRIFRQIIFQSKNCNCEKFSNEKISDEELSGEELFDEELSRNPLLDIPSLSAKFLDHSTYYFSVLKLVFLAVCKFLF
jgi:hypothetical protein